MNPRPILTLEGVVVPFEPHGVRFSFDILCGEVRYLCFAAPTGADLPIVREGDRVRLRGRWSAALKCVFEVCSAEVLQEFDAPVLRQQGCAARQ